MKKLITIVSIFVFVIGIGLQFAPTTAQANSIESKSKFNKAIAFRCYDEATGATGWRVSCYIGNTGCNWEDCKWDEL